MVDTEYDKSQRELMLLRMSTRDSVPLTKILFECQIICCRQHLPITFYCLYALVNTGNYFGISGISDNITFLISFGMYFTFKALAGKLNLGKECVPNFALFEIMDNGFGKSKCSYT